ncbi:MAG: hypothetical protein M3510_10395, partial [Actinomycetota bacterium]|nr:hypothetical protein [Actinomycetota bacterium]
PITSSTTSPPRPSRSSTTITDEPCKKQGDSVERVSGLAGTAQTHPEHLDDIDAELLAKRLHTTNPAALRRQVSDLQGDLLTKVKHKNITRRGKQNAAYLSRAKLDESTKKPTRAS